MLMSNTVVCSLPSMLMSITAVRNLSPYAPVIPPFVLESFYGLYNSLCRFFHFDLMLTFIFCALIVYIFNLSFQLPCRLKRNTCPIPIASEKYT